MSFLTEKERARLKKVRAIMDDGGNPYSKDNRDLTEVCTSDSVRVESSEASDRPISPEVTEKWEDWRNTTEPYYRVEGIAVLLELPTQTQLSGIRCMSCGSQIEIHNSHRASIQIGQVSRLHRTATKMSIASFPTYRKGRVCEECKRKTGITVLDEGVQD